MSTTTRKFKTVITDTGAKKLAQAAAPDGKPVRLTHMAVGDGGGTLPTPDSKQTRLVHEVWRHTVNRVILDATHQNRIIAELVIPPETGGFWIREIGVFDEHGDLIAVGNTAESYKPTVAEGSGRAQTFRTILTVSSTATVALTVDNTMVMATVDYVDDKLKEHEQSRRHPDASLTAKGFVQLSSATNSVSETQAATPKAVKAAYDLANGKYTAQDATTARKGLVQLSSATNSTSETLAATPKAVKAAYDNAEKRLQKDQNGGDIPDKGTFLNNINAVSKTDFAAKRGMRYVRVNAPAGAISGKYYPVVVMRSAGSVSELASRVIITTATRAAGDPMNNCEFNGFVMPGGWTDRGRYAYGMFWQYQNNERAIHSIMMSNKGDDLRSVFYVDGAAFPVFAFIEDGLSISAPGADLVVNDTTYKFGATNPATECIAADVILDFKSGRGFYES
ncbi:TPA: phage tail protein, partial [Escherichia coli]|nr:phage tail protein [Escherichia coli]